jgi:hypothetical protein
VGLQNVKIYSEDSEGWALAHIKMCRDYLFYDHNGLCSLDKKILFKKYILFL